MIFNMANTYDQFLEDDDAILACALEESLRHYNENEIPSRSINTNHCVTTNRTENNIHQPCSSTTVIDLCQSPKKRLTVQSRLSHFFTKHTSDIRKPNYEIQEQTENCMEVNSDSVFSDIDINSSPTIIYKGPDAEGFHLSSGSHYVYPTNYPVREYQMKIIYTALFHNTLISLPTGSGKTFIAAVVMYNFYRWYPMGKVVFMAPTRPLVAQQIEACCSIMGIPKEMTFEMTGNIPPEQRYTAWQKYRVFFLTPQVLVNDLNSNKCPSETLRCIIVDEAHRATKDYAYVHVLRHLQERNRIIRIVGLSATPGTTLEAVIEVVQNLSISKLEFRTDESPDVQKYTFKKNIECVSVELTNAILNIRAQFLQIYDKYSRRLKQNRILNGNVTNLTKFQILCAKQKFVTSNLFREMPKSLTGCLINDFTICMSFAYALELLIIYGVKVFYLQLLELLENHKCLSNDPDIKNILSCINNELNSQDLTWSHPKLFQLKNIVQDYFNNENTESSSKIIIFCQYRLVVVEIFELLKTFGSNVKPVMFVGQSVKEKGGLCQKKQLEVMRRFKSGDFNVLIATSVAEEGLDIGEVDLIICLESNKSPIKFIQRLGRTGRKRAGKCITLLTEGKEQMKYKSSVSSSKTLVTKMLKSTALQSKLGPGGPRLIPKHLHPKRLMIHVKPPEEKRNKRKISEENTICEEALDVFENKDRPKRKRKKRKIATDPEIDGGNELDTVRGENTAEDLNVHPNGNGAEYVPGNDNSEPADCGGGAGGEDCDDACRFADEEKAFDAWVQSCRGGEQIRCPALMNDEFFKLLRLFTTECRAGAADDDARHEVAVVTATVAHDDRVERPRAAAAAAAAVSFRDFVFGSTSPVGGDFDAVEKSRSDDDDDDVANVDFAEEFFKSQRADEYIEKYNENIAAERSSPVGGDFDAVEKSRSDDDDDDVANVDFAEEFFKSQRADEYIEKYNENIAAERSSPVGGGAACEPKNDVDSIDLITDDDDEETALRSRRTAEKRDVPSLRLRHTVEQHDVVFVDSSPELFSCKLPKEIIRSRLTGSRTPTDHVRAADTELVDLTSTSPEDDGRVDDTTTSPAPRHRSTDATVVSREDDMDFLFVDDDDDDDSFLADVKRQDDDDDDVFTQKPPRRPTTDEDDGRKSLSPLATTFVARPSRQRDKRPVVSATSAGRQQTRSHDSLPFNIMKACNLLKPGLSLKRVQTTTAAAAAAAAADDDDVSPINPARGRRRPLNFSQSTPNCPARRPETAAVVVETAVNVLSTSSGSESDDVFAANGGRTEVTAISRRRVKKRRKPKKKLVFIDDEAEVTRTEMSATSRLQDDSNSSSSGSDGDEDFDSSFIDDVDKFQPSTSMTKQYLQSVKSPSNVRGIFKIPKLCTQHYKINVYSQMDDRNDNNSYEEDSFCVANVSDLNTSSNTSAQEELKPSKHQKRKRILSPQSSDSNSPNQLNSKTSSR